MTATDTPPGVRQSNMRYDGALASQQQWHIRCEAETKNRREHRRVETRQEKNLSDSTVSALKQNIRSLVRMS